MKFDELVHLIKETDDFLKQKAYIAINQSLTIKNWLTGFYIVEFEQNGEDHAKYGEQLLKNIANELKNKQVKGYSFTNILLCRQFYKMYPFIGQIIQNQNNIIYQSATDKFENSSIYQSATDKFKTKQSTENQQNKISQSLTDQFKIELTNRNFELPIDYLGVEPNILIKKLSYTHLVEIMQVADPLKRAFYEIECIKGNWSVRELQRQIGSLLFERTGLSTNKEKLIELTNFKADNYQPALIIKDPFMFEFLGLKQSDVILEDKLEDLLIIHLQEFLLELGKGFCFEARQKRITIDNRHFYIDLVFYHKILKCNVIIELKTRKFEHGDASQLRVYVNYYRKNEMHEGDNPPVGILLCTDKSDELIEYATAGIDEQLFISKYMVELPTKEQLKEFITNEKKQYGFFSEE